MHTLQNAQETLKSTPKNNKPANTKHTQKKIEMTFLDFLLQDPTGPNVVGQYGRETIQTISLSKAVHGDFLFRCEDQVILVKIFF